MPYTIKYFKSVKDDVRRAKDWYKKQPSFELDKRFATAVKEVITALEKYPERYGFYYRQIRAVALKVFPYKVYFYIDDDGEQIVVIAILHNKQDRSVIIDDRTE
jgi:plasmid stabilization system protein ParE